MRTKPHMLTPELSPAPMAAHLPTPTGATGPTALAAPPSDTPYLDANGFDPAAYRWVPVRRKPRSDGWTEERQRAFIEALADGGSVDQAARGLGMTRAGAYALRRAPGSEGFARAWDAAIAQAVGMLVDVAFERAVHGSEEPVFDRAGRQVGFRHRSGDRLLMFLLAAHYPDRYGRRGRSRRSRGGDAPLPIAQALERLAPVAPGEPHRLMTPGDLDVAIEVADICDGTLPGYHDPHRPPAEPAAPLARDDDADAPGPLPEPGPLGERFEIELALAKRGIAVLPDHPRPRRAKPSRV